VQVESLVGNAGALKRVYGYRKKKKKKHIRTLYFGESKVFLWNTKWPKAGGWRTTNPHKL